MIDDKITKIVIAGKEFEVQDFHLELDVKNAETERSYRFTGSGVMIPGRSYRIMIPISGKLGKSAATDIKLSGIPLS